MNQKNKEYALGNCLSGSMLKLVAVVSMTVDHIALYLLAPVMETEERWAYELMRCIGRIAFPVFAFLIVEGYCHTRCLWKYLLSLLVTAIISEIPWQLLGNADSHNVIFTLLTGLMAVWLINHASHSFPLMLLITVSSAILATTLHFDYEWRGIGLMVVFFLFRGKRLLTLPFGFPLIMEYGTIGPALGLTVPQMYSGRRGFIKGRWMKYLFYIYYPLHLMVIWQLNRFLANEF